MADYRRYSVHGGTYFFTLVTYKRRPLFLDPTNVDLLRTAIASVQSEMPFEIHAAAILPDHMHFIWSLPRGDSAYSKRIGMMKVKFTRAFYAQCDVTANVSGSRAQKNESDIWQRRFWEHTITDEDEFQALFDYIHFNPVKHGHAACPHEWPASSFHKCVKLGVLDRRWGCSCDNRHVAMNFTKVEDVGGE